MAASTMTERLRIDPDEVAVLGSKSMEHRIPRSHRWKIVRRSSESIDEQLEQLVDRLEPFRHQLTSLLGEPGVHASMQVLRHYGDPDGVHGAPDGTPFTECQDWPRPLGWHLSLRVLRFLVATGADQCPHPISAHTLWEPDRICGGWMHCQEVAAAVGRRVRAGCSCGGSCGPGPRRGRRR
ncbi:DUF4279 domain-containing protein [Nocardia sp. NPDC050717]|uniref:DUF4279 domain-containing protein n=1 Tax=Nocardia sp. NPDC050717 TaxID=3157221 RepID=UPI0033EA4388